jgi:hypothetical protein
MEPIRNLDVASNQSTPRDPRDPLNSRESRHDRAPDSIPEISEVDDEGLDSSRVESCRVVILRIRRMNSNELFHEIVDAGLPLHDY